ncbi:kinase [Fusarium albosuccineum]|uniref:Kinase n=1 Tax=Fusarium albosuccineum TaxID=1237068 RepID=A0A8H4KY42_9HYPO|nr:kinase [Fusarium albosuccineum]
MSVTDYAPNGTSDEAGENWWSRYPDIGLKLSPFGLEHLFNYQPGGMHPVHLHDTLGKDGRYRVIHKLGHGGFGVIWLCRDVAAKLSRYVAVKILASDIAPEECQELQFVKIAECLDLDVNEDIATSICLPSDHFQIKGPNGNHVCFIYPVLGPRVSHGVFSSKDRDKTLRNICYTVVKLLGFLHSKSICHGDLTAGNILHQVHGLNGLSEHEVLRILGAPVQNPILKNFTTAHDEPSIPQYLVYPVKWGDMPSHHISEQPSIIDFGEFFNESKPPDELGIPLAYRSPEFILENKIGVGVDIWALGCTIFEIRTGRKLFATFDNDDDCSLDAMVEVLGKFPEPWWSTTWEGRTIFYPDDAEDDAVRAAPEPKPNVTVHPSVAEGARSIEDKLVPGVWYMSSDSPENMHRDIPREEIKIFADLLRRFLRYDPKERLGAEAALEHEWFKM